MGNVIKVRFRRHARASAGRTKDSMGTAPSLISLNRAARESEASLRPAKIFRRCESEQSAASASAPTVTPVDCAQANIGCVSDIELSISDRNTLCQDKTFLSESSFGDSALVKSRMGKKAVIPERRIYLAEWMATKQIKPRALWQALQKPPYRIFVDESYIANIAGQRKPGVNVVILLAISEIFGIKVNDLYEKPPTQKEIGALGRLSPEAQDVVLQRKSR